MKRANNDEMLLGSQDERLQMNKQTLWNQLMSDR